MDREPTPAERWQANEAELQRLRDLPVGSTDPAARERELEREQDEIEYEVAKEAFERNRDANRPDDSR